MLFRITAIFIATLNLASAGITPELHVGVTANDAKSVTGAFSPSVKWTAEGNIGDCDVEGGVDMRSDDLANANVPFSVWGSLSREVGGWNLKARAEAKSDSIRQLDIDVQADGGPTDLRLRAQGSFDTDALGGELREVGLSQSFEAPGGDLRLSPNYNLASGKADIKINYDIEDTSITVDADLDRQKVTVAQRIDDDNTIAPSITSDGDLEIEYRRVVGEGLVTANYRPNDSTSIKYEEGPWTAQADIPMDGFYKLNNGAKFSVRRSVSVEAS